MPAPTRQQKRARNRAARKAAAGRTADRQALARPAAREARRAAGRDWSSVDRWEVYWLAAELHRLGVVSENLLRLLRLYIGTTFPQDWSPGATPAVWRAPSRTAARLEISVETVRNIEAEAEEFGWFVRVDRLPGTRRQGYRDRPGDEGGEIVSEGCWGAWFAPLERLVPLLEWQVRVAREAHREIRALHRDLRTATGRVRAAARAQGWKPVPGGPTPGGLAELFARHRRRRSAAAVRRAIEQLRLWAGALIGMPLDAPADEAPPAPAASRRRWREAVLTASRPRDPPPAAAGGDGIDAAAGPPPDSQDVPLYRLLHLMATELNERAGGEWPAWWRGWEGLCGAAAAEAELLGLDQAAWRAAAGELGPRRLAGCVVITAWHEAFGDGEGERLRSPLAYLRGMIERGAIGELHVARSVWGLTRQLPGWQEAVAEATGRDPGPPDIPPGSWRAAADPASMTDTERSAWTAAAARDPVLDDLEADRYLADADG